MAFWKKSTTTSNGQMQTKAIGDAKLKFETIINNIEDGVVLFDADLAVQLYNPGAAHITGWAIEDAVGISILRVMPLMNEKNEPIPDQVSPFATIFATKQTIKDNKAIVLSRDKQSIPISLSVTPLFDDNQQMNGAVAVFRNVSEERAEEQQRADFISTASHEMRTPVAAIEGYLALALNDKVSTIDNRARDYLEKAHSSTQHLGQLFQDLLTSAKAEDGRLTSHPTVVEFGEFLESLTNDLRFVAEKKGLEVNFIVGSNNVINASSKSEGGERVVRPLYYVYADADRMREVITNLFDNAVKYTPEGKITLSLTGNDQVVQCSVRDTGPGIPAEDVSHLFQKFYRVDNSATRTIGGTGLGLFICRKIVELYNGRIWVESELGKGSSFYINLPRLSTEKAAQMRSAASSTSGTTTINSKPTS